MRRTTLIVVAVFAVLLIAVLLTNRGPVERGTERLELGGLDAEAARKIVVTSGEATLEVVREDGVWRLTDGHLADPETVDRALDALREIATSDVITDSAERHETYGVDDSGVRIEVDAGRRNVDLVVGEPASDGGTYVRPAGRDTVFRVSASLRHRFPTDAKQWLKLRLADVAPDEATRVEIDLAGAEPWAIEPEPAGEGWRLVDPSLLPESFRFDATAARSLARTAAALRATEIVEEAPAPSETGLEGEHDIVIVQGPDATTIVHLGTATEDNSVYARVEGRDALMLIPAYQARTLRKQPTDLRDLRPMALDPEQAVALEIDDGDRTLLFERGEDGAWSIPEDAPQPPEDMEIDLQGVDRLLVSVAGLRAAEVAEGIGPNEAGLDDPSPVVRVGLVDGGEAILAFGDTTTDGDDRNQVYVAGNADDLVYLAPEHQQSRFTRGWQLVERVQPPPGMTGGGNPFANLDPETLKNLPPEVRESLMKQMQQEAAKQRLLQQMQQQSEGRER